MKRKSFKELFPLIVLAVSFYSCGEGTVEIGQNTYEPKIVIEGYLYPGQKIENIRITRNIPLNRRPDPKTLILFNADVKLVDLQNNEEFKLTFNPQKFSFEYSGTNLSIGFGKSYKLIVSAKVDEKNLTASSITTVPQAGFKIIDGLSKTEPLFYRERDDKGNVKNFSVTFSPSVGTDFYVISIVSLNASDSTFIYDNAYVEMSREEIKNDLEAHKFRLMWLQNINSRSSKIKYDLDWINIWFYGDYRIIFYAGDNNFKQFVLTYKSVQEFDGNFHEPRMNMQGDGIGIFASAIADTVYLKVKK